MSKPYMTEEAKHASNIGIDEKQEKSQHEEIQEQQKISFVFSL